MKILQINTAVNTGSTSRIAEDIGKVLLEDGHQSIIAAGFTGRPSASQVIRIGDAWDQSCMGLKQGCSTGMVSDQKLPHCNW